MVANSHYHLSTQLIKPNNNPVKPNYLKVSSLEDIPAILQDVFDCQECLSRRQKRVSQRVFPLHGAL